MVEDEDGGLAQAGDEAAVTDSEAVVDDAPIAAAVATPAPAAAEGAEAGPEAASESAPRPMLGPRRSAGRS